MNKLMNEIEQKGLYNQNFEHDNCGIGAIVNIKGKANHALVEDALSIVENLEHRAGKDAEGKTGDGVGILTQIPHKYFKKILKKEGVNLPNKRGYAVGMFFFPQNDLERKQAKTMFEIIVKKEGLNILAWRKVEVCPNVLGSKALECMPVIAQVFIERPEGFDTDLDFDRKLYVIRREFEQSN
ncbi:MAG TPA: glutamate synthase subunit alpha, partial [Eubacterium sp.]|nr:glutamate synthase subunit alpha [Eubacterium sp.]